MRTNTNDVRVQGDNDPGYVNLIPPCRAATQLEGWRESARR